MGLFFKNTKNVKTYSKTSNIRLGGEMKILPFILRTGYSRYGSAFKNKDYYSQNFSYGLGIQNKGYYLDVAYILSQANNEQLLDNNNTVALVNTDHILTLTLGFRY